MATSLVSRARLPAALALATCGLATLLGSRASAQVVLDDFSTNKLTTSYVQKNVDGFHSGGWNVLNGILQPDAATVAGGSAPLVWTSNSLQNVGDWFAIDIYLGDLLTDHNGGLSFWASNSTTSDLLLTASFHYNVNDDYTFQYAGSDPFGPVTTDAPFQGSITDIVRLKVTLSGRDASDSFLTFAESEHGRQIDDDVPFTLAGFTGPLYLGPSASLDTTGVVLFDNFTYSGSASAIPEPSSYAAILGLCACLAVAWRRRALGLAAWRRRLASIPAN